jgi:hypothetical protein
MSGQILPWLSPFENVLLAVTCVAAVWLLLRSLGVGMSVSTSGFGNPWAAGHEMRFASVDGSTNRGHSSSQLDGFRGRKMYEGMTEAPSFWTNQMMDPEQAALITQEGSGDDGTAWDDTVGQVAAANPTVYSAPVAFTQTTQGFRRAGFGGKKHGKSGFSAGLDVALQGGNASS